MTLKLRSPPNIHEAMVIFWDQVFKTSGASQSFHTSYFFEFIRVPAFLQEVLSKICGYHCSGLSQKHSINYAESASSPMRKSMTMDQRKRKSFFQMFVCEADMHWWIPQDYTPGLHATAPALPTAARGWRQPLNEPLLNCLQQRRCSK